MTEKLIDLIDNTRTDKDTRHSYIDVYERLFSPKRDSAKNVLEIGIDMGGSIKLWDQYFINADVFGIDLRPPEELYDLTDLLQSEKIHLYTSTDAYNQSFIQNELINNNFKFDVIIDDGPHTIESQVSFIESFSDLLTEDGILVIEDIQKPEFLNVLSDTVMDDLKPYIEIYDFGPRKKRHDDIMFVINLNK